jgi:hypothetical protein
MTGKLVEEPSQQIRLGRSSQPGTGSNASISSVGSLSIVNSLAGCVNPLLGTRVALAAWNIAYAGSTRTHPFPFSLAHINSPSTTGRAASTVHRFSPARRAILCRPCAAGVLGNKLARPLGIVRSFMACSTPDLRQTSDKTPKPTPAQTPARIVLIPFLAQAITPDAMALTSFPLEKMSYIFTGRAGCTQRTSQSALTSRLLCDTSLNFFHTLQ